MNDFVESIKTMAQAAKMEEISSRLKRYEDFVIWLEGFIRGVECSIDEEFFPVSEIRDKLNDIREQEKQLDTEKSKLNEMIKQCRKNEEQNKIKVYENARKS